MEPWQTWHVLELPGYELTALQQRVVASCPGEVMLFPSADPANADHALLYVPPLFAAYPTALALRALPCTPPIRDRIRPYPDTGGRFDLKRLGSLIDDPAGTAN